MRIFFFVLFTALAHHVFSQLTPQPLDTQEVKLPVVIEATRAGSRTPMAFSELTAKDILPLNSGQDMPYLLRFTPSLVATSDAGNGVGYTGLWIRGSDPSRINVTINGVPLNDPESQQVFWVNTPDLGSSASNIQVQRGIGTSTNGAASFGGAIKIDTRSVSISPFAEVNNTYGSFNTWKNTVGFGTGLIQEHWVVEGRLSRIASEGYIDRASSNLTSFFLEGNYLSAKTTVKLTAFGGRERTYQSWYGTPWEVLEGTEEDRLAFAVRNGLTESQTTNLLQAGRTYNYYEYQNQVDNYGQDHFQGHLSQQLHEKVHFNVSGHFTRGEGYFEEYKEGEGYSDYGLAPVITGADTILYTNLVRRRWLKNNFYGGILSLVYHGTKLESVLGTAWNEYDGTHFGELTWMQFAGDHFIGDHYYDGKSVKRDGNVYWKNSYALRNRLDLYADLQVRMVDYTTSGVDNDQRPYDISDNLLFFNPKAGVNVRLNARDTQRAYFSVAMAGKEPNRNDYIDAFDYKTVKPEEMIDFEAGYKRAEQKFSYGINAYYMQYKNQLVLTGELNDVGAPLRVNVPESYRRGVELEAGWNFFKGFNVMGNLTLSQNKIQIFSEIVYDYTVDYEVISIEHKETDISFSPSVISAGQLSYRLETAKKESGTDALEIAWMTKYVGKQYLDNTQRNEVSIDPYLINDLRLTYDWQSIRGCNLYFNLVLNNLLDAQYSSNGYTYGYIVGERVTERFYYPQAGRNVMMSVGLKF